MAKKAKLKRRTLKITEHFGVFEFMTKRQLMLVRTVLELMPKAMRAEKEENFIGECAEAGAMHLLGGAYCAVGEKKVAEAAKRADKAIEQEYRPSPDKPPSKAKRNKSK